MGDNHSCWFEDPGGYCHCGNSLWGEQQVRIQTGRYLNLPPLQTPEERVETLWRVVSGPWRAATPPERIWHAVAHLLYKIECVAWVDAQDVERWLRLEGYAYRAEAALRLLFGSSANAEIAVVESAAVWGWQGLNASEVKAEAFEVLLRVHEHIPQQLL